MKWKDLEQELLANPGFEEGYERLFPYDAIAIELNGLRADLDMTQTEFGRLVGVPQSTVARLESGQQNPSVGMLKRIAAATGNELVIEFRRPMRKRRAKSRSAAASSAGDTRSTEPLAASSGDD
jgi:transcriptional regulator with XRE-family HTH domain